MLIHDAASAFVAVITAAPAWVQVLAGFAAMVLCAVPLCIAPGVKAARSRLRARLTASHASQAPEPHPSPKRRPVPSWARTDPRRYDNAA